GHRLTPPYGDPDAGRRAEESGEHKSLDYDLTVAASVTDPDDLIAAAREALRGEADVVVLFPLAAPCVVDAGLFRLAAPIVLPNGNTMSGDDDEQHEARWFLMICGHGANMVMEEVEEICEDHFGFLQHVVEAVY